MSLSIIRSRPASSRGPASTCAACRTRSPSRDGTTPTCRGWRAIVARICDWQIGLFGEAPFDRYLFQVTAVGDGYGGLEHRASTSLLCQRDELPHASNDKIDDDYLTFLGLASHEYFHAWNVKRIKPAAFVPYDLTREAYTRQLWAFEGLTSYYDDLALVRCGLIDAERYLELLGRTHHLRAARARPPHAKRRRLELRCVDQVLPAGRERAQRDGELLRARDRSSACALDLMLRRDSSATLDDLMRALWQRYGRTGIGVPEDAIPRLASELAGRDLSRILRALCRRHRRPAACAISSPTSA